MAAYFNFVSDCNAGSALQMPDRMVSRRHVLSIYARWFIVIQLPNRWLLVSDGPAPPRPLHKLYDILVKEGVWDPATMHIVYMNKKRFKK